jgi:hypothetical protein
MALTFIKFDNGMYVDYTKITAVGVRAALSIAAGFKGTTTYIALAGGQFIFVDESPAHVMVLIDQAAEGLQLVIPDSETLLAAETFPRVPTKEEFARLELLTAQLKS